MTEGFARDFASYDTTYGARRQVATDGVRWRTDLALPAPRRGARLFGATLVAALLALTLWPSPVEVGSRPAAGGTPRRSPRQAGSKDCRSLRRPRCRRRSGRDRSGSAARATRFGYALAGGGVRAELARDAVRLSGAGAPCR